MNLSAARGIGPIHNEMIWEVDEMNSVHNETNRNNDSTTRNANLVSNLTSYFSFFHTWHDSFLFSTISSEPPNKSELHIHQNPLPDYH